MKGTGQVLQIGEVAARVGLSLRTIRHWDEVGLVVPSARSAGGFRLYTDDDVQRLLFVKSLKPLDLSLEQIRDLVQLIDTARHDTAPDSSTPFIGHGVAGSGEDEVRARAADVRSRLALYRAAAEARIDALRAQLYGLESLARELKALSGPLPSTPPGELTGAAGEQGTPPVQAGGPTRKDAQ